MIGRTGSRCIRTRYLPHATWTLYPLGHRSEPYHKGLLIFWFWWCLCRWRKNVAFVNPTTLQSCTMNTVWHFLWYFCCIYLSNWLLCFLCTSLICSVSLLVYFFEKCYHVNIFCYNFACFLERHTSIVSYSEGGERCYQWRYSLSDLLFGSGCDERKIYFRTEIMIFFIKVECAFPGTRQQFLMCRVNKAVLEHAKYSSSFEPICVNFCGRYQSVNVCVTMSC